MLRILPVRVGGGVEYQCEISIIARGIHHEISSENSL